MFLLELKPLALLETAASSLLCLALLLALCHQLWALRWSRARDPTCPLPLPRGSMGWPFFGETLHWLVQGSDFHSSRRRKLGPVFKTHLLGKPLIRVSGAEHVRRILLGEHTLVSSQWPHSTQVILGTSTLVQSVGEEHRQRRKIMAQVFSTSALNSYTPRIWEAVNAELRGWCQEPTAISVYAATKALTFRIAARILLGLRLGEHEFKELAKIFEQLVENLFSLPLDIPFSGLRKGIKARNTLHEYMEKAIAEKLQKNEAGGYSDALDFMINSGREQGKEFTLQELKEAAIELIFAAFFTTASASTSLILLLMKHPTATEKIREELVSYGLNGQCRCHLAPATSKPSADETLLQDMVGTQAGQCARTGDTDQPWLSQPIGNKEQMKRYKKIPRHPEAAPRTLLLSNKGLDPMTKEEMNWNNNCNQGRSRAGQPRLVFASQEKSQTLETPRAPCQCRVNVALEQISRLQYLDCVVKEVLRLLPPVSGGYRTALQTFELDGYQIPKGWSVMYSIRDTHETATIFDNPELFDPQRFGPDRDESRAGRFNYIPFGGGARSCIGKELALIILKILAIELVSTARWDLATADYPQMQTVPIVHPVDGLHVYFNFLDSR